MSVPPEQVKLVLLGDSGVGKSSLLQRFVNDTFEESTDSTMGASYLSKIIGNAGRSVKFNIWDTAGQERYRALAKMYYRDALVVLLVFSLTDADSFASLKHWYKEVLDNAPKNVGQLYRSVGGRGEQGRLTGERRTEPTRSEEVDGGSPCCLPQDECEDELRGHAALSGNRFETVPGRSDPEPPAKQHQARRQPENSEKALLLTLVIVPASPKSTVNPQISAFLPSTRPHFEQECTQSCSGSTQKGIRQHPRPPPSKQIPAQVSQVPAPGS